MPACLRAHRGEATKKKSPALSALRHRHVALCFSVNRGADGGKEADCRGLTLRGVQKLQRIPEVNKVALIALKYFSALIA